MNKQRLLELAGVLDEDDKQATVFLVDKVKAASYNEALQLIYGWVKIGKISVKEFRLLLQANSVIKETV